MKRNDSESSYKNSDQFQQKSINILSDSSQESIPKEAMQSKTKCKTYQNNYSESSSFKRVAFITIN